MRHNIEVNPERFAQLAEKVFNVENMKTTEALAEEGINKLSEFWSSLGAPNSLGHFNIDETHFEDMVNHSMANGPFGNFKKLQREDVEAIIRASY